LYFYPQKTTNKKSAK